MTKECWILRADFRRRRTSDDCLLAPVFVQDSQVAHIFTLEHDSFIWKYQLVSYAMQRGGAFNSKSEPVQDNLVGEKNTQIN